MAARIKYRPLLSDWDRPSMTSRKTDYAQQASDEPLEDEVVSEY